MEHDLIVFTDDQCRDCIFERLAERIPFVGTVRHHGLLAHGTEQVRTVDDVEVVAHTARFPCVSAVDVGKPDTHAEDGIALADLAHRARRASVVVADDSLSHDFHFDYCDPHDDCQLLAHVSSCASDYRHSSAELRLSL